MSNALEKMQDADTKFLLATGKNGHRILQIETVLDKIKLQRLQCRMHWKNADTKFLLATGKNAQCSLQVKTVLD